jgi:hypothetical protein
MNVCLLRFLNNFPVYFSDAPKRCVHKFTIVLHCAKQKEGKETTMKKVVYIFVCSLRRVIGDVLVSPMPLIALKTSPTKCRLFSLLSALKKMTKSQYP